MLWVTRNALEKLLRLDLEDSAKKNCPKVMIHLINNGADATRLPVENKVDFNDVLPSRAVFELLTERGWDINSCVPRLSGTPFLRSVFSDTDLVN